MKQRILEILKTLMEVRKETDLRLSDEILFSEAVSCWRGEQVGKEYRYNKTEKVAPTPIETNLGTSDKPSPKQIAFLNKHKVAIPKTKKEATKMIKEYIENQNAI